MTARNDAPPHVQLIQMAAAIWQARAVYAAAHLGIPDLLADGSRSAAELAAQTDTHAPSLHRLMRALASLGVLTEVAAGRFALTSLGQALRTGAPGSARATVLTLAGDWQWKAWGNFIYSLRTGKPGLAEAFGKSLFQYLASNPEDAAHFNEAMIGIHGTIAPAVAEAYDFSSCRTVVDVGGGTGTLLTAILQHHQHLRGILFELPETASSARRLIQASGVRDRCEISEGDFFKAVPPHHDAYILAHVLHDWTDEQARPILDACRKAMGSEARLLVVEAVLPAGDAPHQGKLLDLVMLTVTGGLERTEEQYAALLANSGFRLTRIVPTATHESVIEAVPV